MCSYSFAILPNSSTSFRARSLPRFSACAVKSNILSIISLSLLRDYSRKAMNLSSSSIPLFYDFVFLLDLVEADLLEVVPDDPLIGLTEFDNFLLPDETAFFEPSGVQDFIAETSGSHSFSLVFSDGV